MNSSPGENDVSARQKETLSLPLGGEAQLSQEQFTEVGLRVKTDWGGTLLVTTQLLFLLFKNYLFFENVVCSVPFDQMHHPVPPPALLRGAQLLTGFLWVVHWKGRHGGRRNDVMQALQVCVAQTACAHSLLCRGMTLLQEFIVLGMLCGQWCSSPVHQDPVIIGLYNVTSASWRLLKELFENQPPSIIKSWSTVEIVKITCPHAFITESGIIIKTSIPFLL